MANADKTADKLRRKELAEEFRRNRFINFTETDILEFLLFFSVQNGETRTIAEKLLSIYGGSLYRIFCASYNELKAIDGVNPQSAILMHAMGRFFRYYAMSKYPDRVNLLDTEYAANYLKSHFICVTREKLLVVLLNNNGELDSIQEIANSSVSSVDASISVISDIILKKKSRRFIIAHNHPGGDATPSKEDRYTFAKLYESLAPFGFYQYQNYIFADDEWTSLVERSEDRK